MKFFTFNVTDRTNPPTLLIYSSHFCRWYLDYTYLRISYIEMRVGMMKRDNRNITDERNRNEHVLTCSNLSRSIYTEYI